MGKFYLSGIPPAPKGVASIKVCYDIDVNGILTVSAEAITTGNTNSIIVSNVTSILSDDEIERMLKEAERYKLEDEELKKKFEAKNSLQDYVYRTRATFLTKNLADKLPYTEAKNFEDEINSTIQWLDELGVTEIDVFENKRKELEKMWDPIITKF